MQKYYKNPDVPNLLYRRRGSFFPLRCEDT